MVNRREIDFTVGPLIKNMILYALPIIGVNVFQVLFTTADLSVLGIFTGNDNAIAGVGAATPIVNLCIAFFTGLALGANILIARCVGEGDIEKSKRFVGTAIVISIVFGTFLTVVGVLLAEQMLIWTNCVDSVLPYATTYLRIYMICMPLVMLYNFCVAILRAVGDALRPFIFLLVGGVLNVLLNIFFVTVVGWDIEGVAIATVVSKGVCGVCALILMCKSEGYSKVERKNLRIYKQEFLEIFIIGLPVAISKCLFSLANVLVSSTLNELGDSAMTAHSITKEIDGFILETVHGLSAATIAVISQNYGAKNTSRIKKVIFLSMAMQMIVCLFLGLILVLLGRTLCGIMTDTQLVLDLCMVRISTVSVFYVVLGLLNVFQEAIRSIGYSFTATLISVLANIILRMIYLFFIYPALTIVGNTAHNLKMLYVLYPASWGVSAIVSAVLLIILFNKVKKKFQREKAVIEQPISAE